MLYKRKFFANILGPLKFVKILKVVPMNLIIALRFHVCGTFKKHVCLKNYRFCDKINKIDFVPPKPYLMKYLTAQFLQIKA